MAGVMRMVVVSTPVMMRVVIIVSIAGGVGAGGNHGAGFIIVAVVPWCSTVITAAEQSGYCHQGRYFKYVFHRLSRVVSVFNLHNVQ